MKKMIFPMVCLLAFSSCTNTEKIEETVQIEQFGPGKVDEKQALSTKEMLAEFNPSKGPQEFTFEGKITEVCSKAGCWINIDKGNGETFMVRFKDHFTIPTKTAPGTMAMLHGTATMDTIPVEDLQHFAEDAGKTKEEIAKITEPQFELNFEADGIMMKKSIRKVTK